MIFMYILFDIGGTQTRLAVSKERDKLENITIFDTPQSFEEGIDFIAARIHIISKGGKVESVAGGIAGPLNKEKSELVNTSNLQDWAKRPLKKELQKRLEAPVYLENDAALAGLGEAVYGAGKNRRIVAYITVSTGVGGARIVEGKIDRNAMGFEPGHQIIEINGPLCPACSIPGHLEGYISGIALRNKYKKNPQDITDEKIWDEVAYYLAFGIHNSILHWSPNAVILGGSIMKSVSLEKVTANLHKILTIFPQVPIVRRSELGDIGGLYGALVMAKAYEKSA